MNITLNARAKINQISSSAPFKITLTEIQSLGSQLDLIPNSCISPLDVTICNDPLIVSDLQSVNHLLDKILDFDYKTDEFIIRSTL